MPKLRRLYRCSLANGWTGEAEGGGAWAAKTAKTKKSKNPKPKNQRHKAMEDRSHQQRLPYYNTIPINTGKIPAATQANKE